MDDAGVCAAEGFGAGLEDLIEIDDSVGAIVDLANAIALPLRFEFGCRISIIGGGNGGPKAQGNRSGSLIEPVATTDAHVGAHLDFIVLTFTYQQMQLLLCPQTLRSPSMSTAMLPSDGSSRANHESLSSAMALRCVSGQ
ncbi:hypothetical protein AWZ03_013543 [Drosophila navojoa]|uniref:Uncharacterized protein n=1 Tax=Drosophila navojoa TaxID=7232 RepID=A0A484AUF6_DRONA|nr:hypothetical protein AWZ03_013543 [Drosophila navojoa]